jgi:hypothetical protein
MNVSLKIHSSFLMIDITNKTNSIIVILEFLRMFKYCGLDAIYTPREKDKNHPRQ